MLNLVLLLLGFIPLIWGATLLVDGGSSLAKRFNIPNIVIGLTIVAFGTSAPELIVNLFSSFQGSSSIAFGNVVGSNIFNILVILGLSALIYPLTVKSNTTWIEIPLCLLAALVVMVLANDLVIDGVPPAALTRIDGLVLLLFFVIFMSYSFQLIKSGNFGEEVAVKSLSALQGVLVVLLGLALLVAGGKLIVLFAVKLARSMGITERVIGLTIVSIGTSLPELATSAVAARKKNVDIAIGNIVGSNIFNSFFILGISAVISPIPLPRNANFDLGVNVFASVLLLAALFTGRRHTMERWQGGVFLLIYGGYLALLLFV